MARVISNRPVAQDFYLPEAEFFPSGRVQLLIYAGKIVCQDLEG